MAPDDSMHKYSKSSEMSIYRGTGQLSHRKLGSLVSSNKSGGSQCSSNSNSTNNSLMHIRNISDDFATMRWDAPGTPTALKPPQEVHIEEGERAAIPKASFVK